MQPFWNFTPFPVIAMILRSVSLVVTCVQTTRRLTHAPSSSHTQLCDFIENEYLQEQVQAIKEISDHITNLKRVGPGLGEYMYDRETMSDE